MNIEIITGPLIGGVIGLVTNGIAIRMLFRPLKPIYIGDFKMPFTPGIIPKEQPKIAKAIGKVVGTKLLDADAFRHTLLSPDLKEKFDAKVDEIVEKMINTDETLGDYLDRKNLTEKFDEKEKSLNGKLSHYLAQKLINADAGNIIVDYIADEILKNKNNVFTGIAEKAINSAKPGIAEKINNIIKDKAPEFINDYIERQYGDLKNTPIKELPAFISNRFPDYKDTLWNLYKKILSDNLERLLRGINIPQIVEDKINDFEIIELEKIIQTITKKEMNALVALGGVLGVIMGFVNLIFI